MRAVVSAGPGFVAGGNDGWGAAVWTSADGLTWTAVPRDEDVFVIEGGSGGAWIWGLVAGGPGVIAVGDDGAPNPASWTSADGYAWQRQQVPTGEEDMTSETMMDVTLGGPGFVAVGTGGYRQREAVVWTSPDGITWTRNLIGLGVPWDDEAITGMAAVAEGSFGLVAVGFQGHGFLQAAVWTSPDGASWTPIPLNAATFGCTESMMRDVVAGGPGFVAVGSCGTWDDHDAAVWTSPDGNDWTLITDESVFGGPDHQEAMAIVAGENGLVAVGHDGPGSYDEPSDDAVVWISPDGVTWTRIPNEGSVFGGPEGMEVMWAVTTAGSVTVAVGTGYWIENDGYSQNVVPAVWVGPAPG